MKLKDRWFSLFNQTYDKNTHAESDSIHKNSF